MTLSFLFLIPFFMFIFCSVSALAATNVRHQIKMNNAKRHAPFAFGPESEDRKKKGGMHGNLTHKRGNQNGGANV